MKNKPLFLPVIFISCCLSCLSLSSLAQNDSTWLDGGVLKLKRNLTQTISIKGKDLEKMPFTNLSEAIGAWLSPGVDSR